KFYYEANSEEQVLKWLATLSSSPFEFARVEAGSYRHNQLYVTRTKDENHHEVIEYTDKEGRTVLKKVQGPEGEWAQTYYVYDDFSNLVCVLPPEGTKNIQEYMDADDAGREAF